MDLMISAVECSSRIDSQDASQREETTHAGHDIDRQDCHGHTVGGEGSVRGSGHLEVTAQSLGQVGDDSTIFQKYSGDCSGSIYLLPHSCSGRGDFFCLPTTQYGGQIQSLSLIPL